MWIAILFLLILAGIAGIAARSIYEKSKPRNLGDDFEIIEED